jgi:tetratricopeptide (TPR) repeat protein
MQTVTTKPNDNGFSLELMTDQRVVLVKELKVASNDVYEFLSRFETSAQREEEFKRALEVGASVLQKVQLVSNVDYFDKRVEQLGARFEANIDQLQKAVLENVAKSFDPAEGKSYTRQLNEFFLQQRRELQGTVREAAESIGKQKEQLENLIDASFDASDRESHLGKLAVRIETFEKEIGQKFDPNVRTSFISGLNDGLERIFSENGTLAKLLDQRLSVENAQSPLVRFKEEIRKEVESVKTELAKYTSALEAKEEVIQKSPEKGYVFEDAVDSALQTIARSYGDIVTFVGEQHGETKGKAGDFVYEDSKLSKKIVIEARSRNITSLSTAIADLRKSMANRGVDYGVYLVENENQLQKQIGIWNEYPDGKIITHAALLEVAIKVAKARLALEKSESEGVDVSAVRQNLTKILESLKKLSSIRRQVTNIKGSGVEIERLADEMQAEIQGLTRLIDDELMRATPKAA